MKNKKLAKVLLLLCLILPLSGCPKEKQGPPGPGKTELGDKNVKGKVTDRKADCLAACWVVVESTDGTISHVDVDQDVWANCTVGSQYPACRDAVQNKRPR